jgi:vacuolar-type H+-ATPase subunit C/Vma6
MDSASPLEHLPEGHFQRTLGERTPEAVWRTLLSEYGWVYHQMNRQLRETFSPFFLYAELRTMIICIRYLRELKRDTVRQMLMVSLLSDDIKKMLSESDDEFSVVQEIEKTFFLFSERFKGIAEIMRTEGLKGFEQNLVERYLSVIVGIGTDPLLRAFFRRLIDARNMLALAKLLRLGTTADHSFIPDGTVSAERFDDILAGRNTQAADKLLGELTGEMISAVDLKGIEARLYRRISRWLKRESREVPGIGPALAYLWKCSIEAINLSILFYGQELGRDTVAAELVR